MSELSCKSCTAACCKGPEVMELTESEAAFLEAGDSQLLPITAPVNFLRDRVAYPQAVKIDQVTGEVTPVFAKGEEDERSLASGVGRYMLVGSCGYLMTDAQGWEYCSVYADRPRVCREFEVGGEDCHRIRALHGIDTLTDEMPDLLDILEERMRYFVE
jgi:Fe-S-cluster containining protein